MWLIDSALQKTSDLGSSPLFREGESRQLFMVGDGWVGSSFHQETHHSRPPMDRGEHQCCAAAGTLSIECGTMIEQQPDRLRVTSSSGCHQCRRLRRIVRCVRVYPHPE
jgi:hypothetical protein